MALLGNAHLPNHEICEQPLLKTILFPCEFYHVAGRCWPLLAVAGLAIALSSCQPEAVAPDPEVPKDQSYYETSPETRGTMMVLGKERENPYSVQNMRKALVSLTQEELVADTQAIDTTHLYVRFLPADQDEVQFLLADSTLELFDHPLLHDIAQHGNWYHDPSIPDSLPTWRYTVVPRLYRFGRVRHEVLSYLYMEGEEAGKQELPIGNSSVNYDQLETEALRLTGNLEEAIPGSNERITSTKWKPRGRIRVENRANFTDQGDVPLRYCKIRARKLLKWGSANSSVSDGTFFIDKNFKGKVKYSIEFKTAGFTVSNVEGFAAVYNGPEMKGSWYENLPFNDNGYEGNPAWTRATFMNAIYHFRTQASRHRLRLPQFSTIRVRAVFYAGRSNAIGLVRYVTPGPDFLVRNDVKIYVRYAGTGNPYQTDAIYRVCMHELGHVTHFLKSPINAGLSIGIVGESWATAVEHYFTRVYYPAFMSNYRPIPDRSRNEIIGPGTDDRWKYTPYFVDMIDNTNQRNLNSGSLDYADDDVSGYTLEQIQIALDRRTTLGGVATHLKNNHSNPSEGALDNLGAFYQDIKDNH